VRVLFLRGAFDATSAADAARMLWHYAFGLPAVSVTFLLTGAFLATGVAAAPAIVRAALLTANVALNWAWLERMQVAGIPLAWSLMYMMNAVCLLGLSARRHPELAAGRLALAMGAVGAAALAGGAGASALLGTPEGAGRALDVLRLAVVGAAAAGASAVAWQACARLLRDDP
jgi:putative peptidoglycan lipid II flippase